MNGMKNDRQWDRKLNIRTRGRDSTHESAVRYAYEPTPYGVLQKLTESGWITKDSVLLDYGSGKGRVSIFMSAETGCKSLGIDFSEDMVRTAEKNLEASGLQARVSFRLADAVRFTIPPDVDRLYFFNPFSASILEEVLKKVIASWYEAPRRILLFFYYPSKDYVGLLARSPEFDFIDELDCSDLFPGDLREKILCFSLEE